MARSKRPIPTRRRDEDSTDPNDVWRSFLEPVNRMSRDMRAAAATLSASEARYLVDSYYIAQENRKRAGGQERALEKSGEPHSIISWLFDQSDTLEKQIKGALDVYTDNHVMGNWMRGIYGIGPVLSAGLLAHIDMNKCPTVGHIWSFAGWAGDNQKPWEKGKKRPFNADFRTLCWKVGDSFRKFHNRPDCYYGQKYYEYKLRKIAQNESGGYKARAAQQVREASPNYKKIDAYKLYNVNGLLSPGHIDDMASRWSVKLFLAHLHGEWHLRHFGRPSPSPYPIAFLGHAHVIPPGPAAKAAE